MQNKKLYRSRDHVMIAGVCSGIAKYLEVDPSLVRLVFLLLLFIGAGGLWIYLILWVIMPVESVTSSGPVVEVPIQPVKSSTEPVKVEESDATEEGKNVKVGQLESPKVSKEKKEPLKKPRNKNVK